MNQEPIIHSSAPLTISKQAIWSLVLGILSLFCLWIVGSIPAIILGALAISNINKSGGVLGGKGLALTGIITGSVGILSGLVSVGIIASIIFPSYNAVHNRAQLAQTHSELRMIYVSIETYKVDHEGKRPATLEDLIPDYLTDESMILCSNRDEEKPYQYFPEATSGEVLLSSPFVLNNRRAVLWADGNTDSIRESTTGNTNP